MNTKAPLTQSDCNDPVVEELHRVRESLVEKYNGDLHAYSQAAKSHALDLGFKLSPRRTKDSLMEDAAAH